jgi:hypothetical protein
VLVQIGKQIWLLAAEKRCNDEALGRDEGLVRGRWRGTAREFHDAMLYVAVFGQMSGGDGLAAACDHLIERAPAVELRVELAAKFTRPAGAGIEAAGGSSINMFHGKCLRKGR